MCVWRWCTHSMAHIFIQPHNHGIFIVFPCETYHTASRIVPPNEIASLFILFHIGLHHHLNAIRVAFFISFQKYLNHNSVQHCFARRYLPIVKRTQVMRIRNKHRKFVVFQLHFIQPFSTMCISKFLQNCSRPFRLRMRIADFLGNLWFKFHRKQIFMIVFYLDDENWPTNANARKVPRISSNIAKNWWLPSFEHAGFSYTKMVEAQKLKYRSIIAILSLFFVS